MSTSQMVLIHKIHTNMEEENERKANNLMIIIMMIIFASLMVTGYFLNEKEYNDKYKINQNKD